MKYFTIKELTNTSYKSIDNTPSNVQTFNLVALCERVLDPAREELGMPITVSSGFRNNIINQLVGGAVNSQHTTGEAADLVCSDNAKLFNYIRNNLIFDQLIWEFGDDTRPTWVHVSYSRQGVNRKEVLRAKHINGKIKYFHI